MEMTTRPGGNAVRITEPVFDLATEKGRWHIRQLRVGDYLEQQDVFDREGQTVQFAPVVTFNWTAGTVQRAVLDIRKNPIKKRMLRDLMRGGTLPPIVVYDVHRPDRRLDVVDGLQRTHVLSEALKALLVREAGKKPAPYAQQQIEQIEEAGQTVISVEQFLGQPITLQVWEHLKADELIRLFMLLNVGQQKVSARHLLEVVDATLRQTFVEWGIPVQTEKEEKERSQLRRSRRSIVEDEPRSTGATPWEFAHLLAGLTAYISRDPHTRIASLPQDEEATKQDKLSERITSLGDEICRADFQWACNRLHPLIRQRYEGTQPTWTANAIRQAIFFVPMMAALGKARGAATAGTIEYRKQDLLRLLRSSSDSDPLHFVSGEQSLQSLQEGLRSNIGRGKRAITFCSWYQYFLNGAIGEYPIDWSMGEAIRP